MYRDPLSERKSLLEQINQIKDTEELIKKGTDDYIKRLSFWFYSVTNRWFGIETDPGNRKEVKALSERVLKKSYSKGGVQHTDFYDANSKEWLLSGCLWLRNEGKDIYNERNDIYKFLAEFTTCYGEKNRPQNMATITIDRGER